MWILTEAPRGSSYYEAQSTTGNKVLISDTCETVIYSRSQGADGHRIVAQRGRETFLIGTAPTRGVEVDMTAKMLDIARQLSAVVLG
ncbi:MAG: hypothetical protein ACSLE9_17505 [Burkholderiaceae bacterium]|jgi:hypothetical protein